MELAGVIAGSTGTVVNSGEAVIPDPSRVRISGYLSI
jgi:hypothetical protein